MSERQRPGGDDSSSSHSSHGEAHDGPADSTQSNVVAFNRPQYLVGYGRTPVHSRFKPGKSGNPKGRPKGRVNVVARLRKFYTDTITIPEGGKKHRLMRIEALAWNDWRRGMKGNQRAAQAAFATAKAVGVFDEPETNECAHEPFTQEEIETLSPAGLADFIRIERERLARRARQEGERAEITSGKR